ncbi:MAG: hypothetical protein RO257_15285 [Candidatus Kapabacteria bacterium]|nr:hypothetical protein [Candidatus Kapabacteria bacterium]
MIKADKSLVEVWDMKERVYIDFLKSGSDNIVDYIKKDTADIIKKYKIKYHQRSKKSVNELVQT